MAAAAAAAAAASGGGGGMRLPPPNPNLPYREDCWSEGETAALVGAWGSRYVELNRGNLRQKQWQEVADAVNSRRGAAARRRPPRTDVQCKNRVDTLKKKYKAERSRNAPSSWSFFNELDRLVGPTLSTSASKRPSPSPSPHFVALPIHPSAMRKPPSPSSSPSPPPPMALPLPSYRRGSPLPAAALIQQEAAAAAAAVSDSEDSEGPGDNDNNHNHNNAQQSLSQSVSSRSGNNNKRSRHEAVRGVDGGFRELARAIEAFGEMYERVENAKQKQELEIERQRIDFLKQLEVKRMENFVDAHVKLARAKHTKKHAGAAPNGIGAAELVSSVAALPFLSTSTYI
ncbi:hypothetical protein GUJ93_ZPchr0010g11007 [Zizania palustris]|uniref:Myb/SANT-like DNA-binding domain-containing protein n=1 Tax=Zizania palustris TaxID=103762 RepID=A0A8J5WDZ3_ZIZPA|nr:hypothetical protein GUJ93_ZPchr0010g11007 [Zizania palustris]